MSNLPPLDLIWLVQVAESQKLRVFRSVNHLPLCLSSSMIRFVMKSANKLAFWLLRSSSLT